jgi:tellurite resistance protein TehA-like permease
MLTGDSALALRRPVQAQSVPVKLTPEDGTHPMEHSRGRADPAWRTALANLSPAYFGMVMATGIVSIAADVLGSPLLARVLFVINVFVYALLWVLNGARLYWFPQFWLRDFSDHLRGPGFFTLVAATSLIGAQFLLLADNLAAGFAFWCLAVIAWVVLTYAILMALTIKEEKPSLEKGISGAWLLAVVATQSIAVLSALLATRIGQPYRLELNFLALSMWLWGGMLYIWMMSLIFYRYTFFHFDPADLSPPYWINMGAMAISTLAGSLLAINAQDAPFLMSLRPFVKGFTILYWATGTWWIPMLLLLGVWRYIYKRFPLTYDPLYWGAVFPFGMYAACTDELMQAMDFHFLAPLPRLVFYIALAGWSAAFIGAVRRVWRVLLGTRGDGLALRQ